MGKALVGTAWQQRRRPGQRKDKTGAGGGGRWGDKVRERKAGTQDEAPGKTSASPAESLEELGLSLPPDLQDPSSPRVIQDAPHSSQGSQPLRQARAIWGQEVCRGSARAVLG